MRSRDWPPSESSPLLSSPRDLDASDGPETPSPTSPDPVVIHLSRADLLWVLVGLWSPVFLGALDGKDNDTTLQLLVNDVQGRLSPPL
jgi:hypothetical protein